MKGTYYTVDDACKVANYDKLVEENKKLKEQLDKATAERDTYKADYNILINAVRNKDKQYLKMIEERDKENKRLRDELYNKNNKQISLEV